MSSKGTLKLGAALMHLHETQSNGIVRFERGKAKKQLMLRRGRVAFAESNQPEEHLVRVLIRAGAICRGALPQVAALMKQGMTADAALIACGEVDAEAINAGVREQATEIIASLLGWEDTVVRYYAGDSLVTRNLDAALHIPALLAAAARRAASNRSSALPQGTLFLSEGSLELARRLPLETAEAYACSLAAQPLGVNDFLNLMPPGEPEASDILRRLLFLGLVRVQALQTELPNGPRDDSAACEVEELLRRFEIADHYEILSVAADAAPDAVKAAYHTLARRYHPDLFQTDRFGANVHEQAERLFTYITAAYATLSNGASRAAYDDQRAGRKLEAARQARAAANLDKEKAAVALFRVGRKALAERDLEKAVATLSECVFLSPGVAGYRRALGCAQAEIPRHRKDAEQNLLQAIELDPMALESYIALGKLYIKVGLPRRAEAQFVRVLQWDPGNAEAQRQLRELGRVPS